MKPQIVYVATGSVGGVRYVTDKSCLFRADLVDAQPSPAGIGELTDAQIAPILATRATAWWALDALVGNPHAPAEWPSALTPDGVELADRVIRVLRAFDAPVALGTSGPMGPVLVTSRGDTVGVVMPLRPRAAAPVPRQWPSRDAFGALQRNVLLGEYDGGTWARHIARLYGDATSLDERAILDALMAALAPGADAFTHGARAVKDGVFIVRELRPEHANRVRAAVDQLAAAYGVTGVVLDDPLDPGAIYHALGCAFAAAGVRESVFLVGALEKMIVIRERLEPVGMFEHYAWWEPGLGTLAGHPLIGNVARALHAKGLTQIVQVGTYDVVQLGDIPAFTIRVLRRIIAGRGEPCVALVTDGLRASRLATTAENSVVRFEVMTWADHFDEPLLATLAQIGRLMFRICGPGGAPFYPGQALRAEPPGYMGWERVLLMELMAPLRAAGGDIDVLRAVPISAVEGQVLAQDRAADASLKLVDGLDARDFTAMTARWFNPPS